MGKREDWRRNGDRKEIMTMKRMLSWLVNLIFIWLVLVVVATFMLPRFGNWRFDAVLSGSMEPALRVGGVVVVKPVEIPNIRVGDIIAYHSGGSMITHRVMEVINGQAEPSFITKGDANEDPDMSPVSASSVVGKVVLDVPYLGYLASFIKTRLGFILAIFIPALAIISLELRNLWRVYLRRSRAN